MMDVAKVRCTECDYGQSGKTCAGFMYCSNQKLIKGRHPAHYSNILRKCHWYEMRGSHSCLTVSQQDETHKEMPWVGAGSSAPPINCSRDGEMNFVACSLCHEEILVTLRIAEMVQGRYRTLCSGCLLAVSEGGS